MNYELAKQLKDKEFPLDRMYFKKNPESLNDLYIPSLAPTLEELIEACEPEKNSFSLGYGGEWRAVVEIGFNKYTKGFKHIRGEGKTPTEAVARLWLELNKD